MGAETPRRTAAGCFLRSEFFRAGLLISSAVRPMCHLIEYGNHLCLPEVPSKSGALKRREPHNCSLSSSVGSSMSKLIATGPSMNSIPAPRPFLYIISRLSQVFRVAPHLLDRPCTKANSPAAAAETVKSNAPNKNFSFAACSTDNILGSQTILERIANGYGRD